MYRSLLVVCATLGAAILGAALADAGKQADPYLVTIDLRPLIERLRSDDLFQTDPAIESLGALGDHAVPALHAALRTESRQARVNIVEILRDIGTPATAAPLIAAAADPDEEVRTAAIEALGRLDDERARPALEAALLGDSAAAARAAAAACRSLCTSPAALRRLVEMSIDPKTAAFARPSLRAAAAGARRPVRALVDEIALPAMREGPADQRILAALVVADAGNPAALPTLRECLSQPPGTATTMLILMCIPALGSSGSAAVAPLAELARGDDRVLRAAACAALGGLVKDSEEARAAYAGCAEQPAPAEP